MSAVRAVTSLYSASQGALVAAVPRLSWDVVLGVVGPVRERQTELEGVSEVGKLRRIEDAEKSLTEIKNVVGDFPQSCLEYAAWLPHTQKRIVVDAMSELPLQTIDTTNDYVTSVLATHGAVEALYYHASRLPERHVGVWRKVFVAMKNRRQESTYVKLCDKLERGGMEPNFLLYATYIEEANENSCYLDVERLYDRMQRHDFPLTNLIAGPLLNSILMNGKPEKAAKIFNELQNPDTRVFSKYISGMLDNSKKDLAVIAADRARSLDIDVDGNLYGAVIKAYHQASRQQCCIEVLDEALSRPGVELHPETLRLGAKHLARFGDAPAVYAIMGSLSSSGIQANREDTEILMKALCVRGAWKKVALTLEKLNQLTPQFLSSTLFEIIAKEMLRKGLVREVRNLRFQMNEFKVRVEPPMEKLFGIAEKIEDGEPNNFLGKNLSEEKVGVVENFPPPHIEELLRKQHDSWEEVPKEVFHDTPSRRDREIVEALKERRILPG